MTKIKKIIHFLLLITFFSCSNLTQKLESFSSSNNTVPTTLKSKQIEKLVCKESDLSIFLENSDFENYYKNIFSQYNIKNKSFIDKALTFSMMELLRRPDVVTLNSRFQVIIKIKNEYYYFDFRPKDLSDKSSYSFIFGLDKIAKTFSNLSLKIIAKDVESNINNSIPVDESLENFIKKNQKEISKDAILSKYFLKADEPITHFETFNKNKISNIINLLSSENDLNPNKYEFNKNDLVFNSKEGSTKVSCNFDINSETEVKNSIENTPDELIHYFGLKNDNNSFLAIVSSSLKHPTSSIQLKSTSETYFLKSLPNPIPIPICHFTNDYNDIFISSLSGRSKGQHIKHLKEYEIYSAKSFNSIRELINFPRHLFLPNPDRILYESKKGRKDQLNFFLTMNFPIYHVENLGNIIGTFENKSSSSISLIHDERTKSSISCIP